MTRNPMNPSGAANAPGRTTTIRLLDPPRGKRMACSALAALVAVAVGLSAVACSGSKHHEKVYADGEAKPNSFWWPNVVDLSPLRQNSPDANPYGADYDYVREFRSLDLATVKKDIEKVMKTS